ncbi:MAG: ChbG/HpnK family deacetylase [Syntrophorhabdales bacterium]|jgi:predicted glycoside hydrolase/deacetylase ChbG (UPF0249 family)
METARQRRLIINGDGFGFTYGINLALFEAAAASAITSVSVNSNFQAANQTPLFQATFPHISIGVHLNPVVGKPISLPREVPSLLNPEGEFWGRQFLPRLRRGYIRKDELVVELTRQVEKVLRMGVPVTHLDSHQNSHLHPCFFSTFVKIAKETGVSKIRAPRHRIDLECERPIPRAALHYSTHPQTAMTHFYTLCLARIARRSGLKMADRLVSVGHGNGGTKADAGVWCLIAKNLPTGTSEIYCHPGHPDDALRRHAVYVEERRRERSILLSPGFPEIWARSKIDLISFHQL